MTQSTNQQPLSFKPVFTIKECQDIEASYKEEWGFSRRVMMEILSNSSEQLMERFKDIENNEETGEAFLEILKLIESYQDHLKAGVELCKSAYLRLLTVGEQIVEISKQQEVAL